MGTEILSFYQNRIKKTWKLAFFSAFFLGLLVHAYKFCNVLLNSDAMYNFYSSQNMVTSGRWFLSIACGLSSYFDLPWVNGILSLCFMGLTAAMIAEVFRMENPVLIVLCSGMLVSFPSITATMAYEFTADGYMLAMALAATSVCLTRIEQIDKAHWKQLLLSSVCICLACGIYQAYVSFAFIFAVCYFMYELLEYRFENRQYWKWIGAQILIYIFALAAYYLIWKLCLHFQGAVASSYQGMDQMRLVGVRELAGVIIKIGKDFLSFFLQWNIFKFGITLYSFLNILFLIFFAGVLLAAIWKSGMLKRKVHLLLLLLCCAALPIGGYMWLFVSPEVYYHGVMLQSMSLLYILMAVLVERWLSKRLKTMALILLVAIEFNNFISANLYYRYMGLCFEKTQAVATEVSTRIHLLDDGTVKYVAFYGGLDEWEEEFFFANDGLRRIGGCRLLHRTIFSPMFLSQYTDFDLSYYRNHDLEYPIVTIDREMNIPAPVDWEFRFPLLGTDQKAALAQTQEVKSMPVWPAAGCVRVVGDTVVVKFSEEAPAEEAS